MRTEPLLQAGNARDVRFVRPLVPFGISECVVKQLADLDEWFAEMFRQLFALKHLLFPFAVKLNRNALRASFSRRFFPN